LRKDYRWFALDMIEKTSPMDKTFKKPDSFDMDEHLRKSWMIWEGEQTQVKVKFSPEIAEVIKRKPSWHPSEKRELLPNGEVELTFTVSGTEEIKWWIYSWIPYVKVLEPKSLRDEMKRDLKKTLLISR
jgi:predicted DNA-binding transcriptional regulator YafY